MEYGCIGEKLGHSFSQEIHAMLGNDAYALSEIAPGDLSAFLKERAFRGVNVTIPYKQTVMDALDDIDAEALGIGAVNTIVNRDGRLVGYNTDCGGMTRMLRTLNVDLTGLRALILGTGGTSRTAMYVLGQLGVKSVKRVSRTPGKGDTDYEGAYRDFRDAELILNTTPCGMFPDADSAPIDLARFGHLRAVADVVYNPLRTRLICQARSMGIPAISGLLMLVDQAVRAEALFMDRPYDGTVSERIYRELLGKKQNIVLTGMPGCGKSTVGRVLAKQLGRELIDTDDMIGRMCGMRADQVIRERGEASFREIEAEAVLRASIRTGCVIATGGGAVLKEINVERLKRNGRIYFLNENPSRLTPDGVHPLTDSFPKLAKAYKVRMPVYLRTADTVIVPGRTAEETAIQIEREHCHENTGA